MSPAENRHSPRWQSRVQSIARPEPDYPTRNQDAAHPYHWAISDGAGGTGFFAADWAQYLCQHLPDHPFDRVEAVSDWFEALRPPFFMQKLQEVQQTFADIADDYAREGSSATLLAVWPQEHDQLRLLHYGDSVALLFDRQGRLKASSLPLMAFTEPPFLLHSNEPLLTGSLHCNTWTVTGSDWLLLASDALGQWLLIQAAMREPARQLDLNAVLDTPHGLGNQIIHCREQYDPAQTMVSLLNDLWAVCTDPADFRRFTDDRHQRGQLLFDDYSLRICLRTPI